MDIREVRRGQLLVLLSEHEGKGRQAALAKRLGKAPAQISQWVNRTRTITEETAREIEDKAGKPERWLDCEVAGAIYLVKEPRSTRDAPVPKLPFTAELVAALSRCDKAKMRVMENTLRVLLGLTPLPALSDKRGTA